MSKVNQLRSLEGDNNIPSTGEKRTSKIVTLTGAALITALSGCGGSGGGGGGSSNQAPEVSTNTVGVSAQEGTSNTTNMITATSMTDPDGDSFVVKSSGTVPAEISLNSTTGDVTCNVPTTLDSNTDYSATFYGEDTNGNKSNNITYTCTGVANSNDAPLNVSLINGPSTVAINSQASFNLTATDLDGINNYEINITDRFGNIVINQSQLIISENNGTYTITIPAGLLVSAGTYTLNTTFTGVDGGDLDVSGPETVTKDFEVVQDSKAVATYTSFSVTDTTVSGYIVCRDQDDYNSIPQSCEYAITLNDASAIPGYVAFGSGAGGNVDFSTLTPNTSYRVRTRIYSFDKESNALKYTETYRVYTTLATNTAPTASDVTKDVGGETITYDLAPDISDSETADNNLTIVVVSGPSHGSLVWNTNSEFTYTVTQGSFYAGDDSLTYKVRDPEGLESEIKTVTLTNVFDF
ncbi:MAG: Ig-like domain-containing protein [Candidatus Gracilibacteria bacterium]|nr:Ig-like domain-containing protein [Candidatus Gracilibacteria bacterium]